MRQTSGAASLGWWGTRRRHGPGERGTALVEFALVLPLLAVLVFGIIDFGRIFQSWVTLTNAAREGARLGTTGASTGNICARVTSTSGVSGTTCSVTYPGGNVPGQSVRVQANANVSLITPLGSLLSLLGGGGMSGSFALSSTADMRIE